MQGIEQYFQKHHEPRRRIGRDPNRHPLPEAVSAFIISLYVTFETLAGHEEVPTVPGSGVPGTPSHNISLRVRGCMMEVEDSVGIDRSKCVWTAGEENCILSHAVTIPIMALMGYSGGGKSFTALGAHGLLPALVARYPPLIIEVTEVLDQKRYLRSYLPNQSAAIAAAAIGVPITESR